jgi:hypothetical protein
MDLTFRPDTTPEIEVEPDGTVEMEFRHGSESMSLLLSQDEFQAVVDRGRELELLGKLTGAKRRGQEGVIAVAFAIWAALGAAALLAADALS